MRSERVRMVARLLKISKAPVRKCILITAIRGFDFFISGNRRVFRAVRNNILSPFLMKIKRFLLKFLFF